MVALMERDSQVYVAAATMSGRLETSRATLMGAVAGLDDEGFRGRSGTGGWTAAEILAHLLDMERVLMIWAHEAISADDVVVAPICDDERLEQAALARRMAVPQLIHGLFARRRDTARFLAGLSDLELARPLFHPDWGSLTVGMLFQRIAEHEEAHASQIKALRVEAIAPTS